MRNFNLSAYQAKGVFEFLKAVFPNTNKLTTYNKLIGELKSEKPLTSKACLICCKPLLEKDVCNDNLCISKKREKKFVKYKYPICIKLYFRKHLQYVLVAKYDNICTYKGYFFIICV